MTSKFEKFRLLLWKNWKIQSRHLIQLFFEIFLPVLLTLVVVSIRGLEQLEKYDEGRYKPSSLECRPSFTEEFNPFEDVIAYSPKNSSFLKGIVGAVQKEFKSQNVSLELEELDDSEMLQEYMENENPFVGIDFFDELMDSNTTPKFLSYILRFRGNDIGDGSGVWDTTLVREINKLSKEPRYKHDMDGGHPHYRKRCFLKIQNIIDETYTKFASRGKAPTLIKYMKRFPHPSYTKDEVMENSYYLLVAFIASSFIFAVRNIISNISKEKECQLKEAMRIAGLSRTLQWSAWFLKSFIMALVSITLITFLMGTPELSSNGSAIFQYSNLYLVWSLLILYMSSMITFCFLVTCCFKKSSISTRFGYLFWILSLVLYLGLLNDFFEKNHFYKFILCLLPNFGMGVGIKSILKLESFGHGLQWENLFSSSNENKFSIGEVMFCLLLSSIIMMSLSLYLERVFPGQYGIPRVWYFPVEKLVNKILKKNYDTIQDVNNEETQMISDNYEDEPTDLALGIQIKGLTKTFEGNTKAVDNLYLNIYQDQITVLLGHNGAGKTTTMSMLSGIFPPTSGTALIDGKNIRTNLHEVRESFGICAQENVLFDELTIREHIIFYSCLKGMSVNQAHMEVQKYVNLFDLSSKIDCLSKSLSGGMKRKLSVAIALCGNSKIVIMDEPTVGMDPIARRKLWDLLIAEKQGRTILLTTHFMDEADVLGDRIAVMANGNLKTIGSSYFLKKKFGVGYRLVCVKDEFCSPDQVTTFLREHIPGIKIETDVGTELTYILEESHVSKFQNLFEGLEKEIDNMGISSFGVSLTTLEEVFLKIGTDSHAFKKSEGENGNELNGNEPNSNGSSKPNQSMNQLKSSEYLKGPSLLLNQTWAMILKKFNYTRRNLNPFIFNLIFTILLIFIVSLINIAGYPDSEMVITHRYYPGFTAIMKTDNQNLLLSNAYAQLIGKNVINITTNQKVDDYLLKKYNEMYEEVTSKYIVGAEFDRHKVIAWFNNENLHSPPLALNFINRAILKQSAGNDYDVEVANFPFMYLDAEEEAEERNNRAESKIYEDAYIIVLMGLLFSTWTSVLISFYIKERVTRSKLLQMISGVNKIVFWLIPYLIDFLILTVINTFIVLLLGFVELISSETFLNFNEFGELFRVWLSNFMFSFAVIPLVYLVSHLFNSPGTGESMTILLGIVTGLGFYFFYFMGDIMKVIEKETSEYFYWLLIFFPHFTYIDTYLKILKINIKLSILDEMCENPEHENKKACKNKPGYYSSSSGIGINLLILFLLGLLYFAILICKEYRLFARVYYRFFYKKYLPPVDEEEMDSDVKTEMDKVNLLTPSDRAGHSLILKNLTKYYGKLVAVKRVCVDLKESICFGLLGVNGAGKTSTFKMLTGDVPISAGNAFVNEVSAKRNMNQIHNRIGYCPQYDALLDELTGRETLKIFCLIRGVPRYMIDDLCQQYATNLDIEKNLDKLIENFSGGDKRKLSAAISFLGDPQVLFLDEPTTGMDPGAKRHLWNVIIEARNQGKSVVLTSHSMEECEALCNRLAIMVNGELKCIGSTQHLKNKFSNGYILTIKAGKMEPTKMKDHILELKNYVNENFKNAVLKEEYLDILTYQIEKSDLKWSQMFGILEAGKAQLHIDDYALGQTSLEQVFLFFTKSSLYSE